MPQSTGRRPAPIATRVSSSLATLGWGVNDGGRVVRARLTLAITSGATAVDTSRAPESGPPRTRDQTPPKVLGRGGDCSLVAASRATSSACLVATDSASASAAVTGA